MNAAHVHLLTTHLPVLGTIFAWCLLLLGCYRKSQELKKVSLLALVIVAVLTVPAYLSGEPSQELLKGMPGITKEIMEQHEEVAQIGFTGMIVLGLTALVGLVIFRRGRPVARWFVLATLALGLIVSGLLIWTANLGGKVRHSEIRGATQGY